MLYFSAKFQSVDGSKTAHGVIYPLNYAIPGYSYEDKPVIVAELETRSSRTIITCKFFDLGMNDSLQVNMDNNTNT